MFSVIYYQLFRTRLFRIRLYFELIVLSLHLKSIPLFRTCQKQSTYKRAQLETYCASLTCSVRLRISSCYYWAACAPSHKMGFGSSAAKTTSRGREDTTVWYRETMFSQMVSYDFLSHEPLHGYFLYLVCAPPEKPTKRCEPEEGYLRCSKRFDHASHSIIFLLFEFKSVR